MQRTPLQKVAAGWALGMIALLLVLAVVPPHLGIPDFLLALFIGIWAFGAAMIWWVPWFGAIGTAAWGLLSGGQALAMHGATTQNLVVVAGSFVGAALALAFLAQLWRARG